MVAGLAGFFLGQSLLASSSDPFRVSQPSVYDIMVKNN
jgi:hypothetical protein